MPVVEETPTASKSMVVVISACVRGLTVKSETRTKGTNRFSNKNKGREGYISISNGGKYGGGCFRITLP